MQYLKNIKQSFKLKNNINYFVLIALLAVLIIADQFGLLGRSLTGLIIKMGYSAILAVSLNLVVGFLGELSLGHAGFMCAGAYIGCFFANYIYFLEKVGIKKFNKKRFRKKASRREMLLNVLEQ